MNTTDTKKSNWNSFRFDGRMHKTEPKDYLQRIYFESRILKKKNTRIEIFQLIALLAV